MTKRKLIALFLCMAMVLTAPFAGTLATQVDTASIEIVVTPSEPEDVILPEDGVADEKDDVVVEEAAALSAKMASAQEKGLAGVSAMKFAVKAEGGVAPYSVHFAVKLGDEIKYEETVALEKAGTQEFAYMAKTYGTFAVSAVVTDAAGATAANEMQLPVVVKVDENTESFWAKVFGGISVGGDWREDILNVAGLLDGYTEGMVRFTIDENGNTTENIAYGDWCAMFVGFVLDNAGIADEDFPRADTAKEMADAVEAKGALKGADFAAKGGDLVFLTEENETEIQHVAIVEDVTETQIKVIEISANGAVSGAKYDRASALIVGYADVDTLLEKAGLLEEDKPQSEAGVELGETAEAEPVPFLDSAEGGYVLTAPDPSENDVWEIHTGEEWKEIATGAVLEIGTSRKHLLAQYRCTRNGAVVAQGYPTREDIRLWAAENEVTDAMLLRAVDTTTLEAVVVEGGQLVYVRTGEAIATVNAETGEVIDLEHQIPVAYFNAEDGELHSINAENAE